MSNENSISTSVRRVIVVRDSRGDRTRTCWLGPRSGITYCGICLQAEVRADEGATCSVCASKVERVMEVVDGGKPLNRKLNKLSAQVGLRFRTA